MRAKLLDKATRERAVPARKPLSTDPRSITLAVAAAFASWFAPAAHAQIAANALPTGGHVSAGTASISTDGSKMQIDQSTGRAILNWQSFSVGSSAWVNFTQPGASSVALNRVVGNDPSHIFGRLTANGQVFLVNNAGVFFAPGASVNVNALFASTLSISDQDFLAGRYQFFNPGSAGSVVNQGNIVTANGYTALVGPQVRNDGVIVARTGSIALVAANRVSLDLVGDGLISINVDQAALNASVINTGTLQADGGTVLLAARSANALLDTVINNSGIIRANSLVERNGEIVLDGGSVGVVASSGTLQSVGLESGATGGTIKVLGNQVALLKGARLDASGDAGGGTVLLGGNFQGRGPEANASHAYVDADATILADAGTSGNGGKVIVWADQDTYFFGHISARGGAQSGDGGFVEVSGKAFLAFRGTADRRAPNGKAGTLLLDPTDMTITAAAGDVVCAAGACTSDSNTSTLSTADLQIALSGGDVVVDATAGGGTGGGTINWTDGSVDANANSLALVGTSITFDGTLTNLNNLDFSTAPTGTGSATSSTGGAITGIGSLTFALSALNTGAAGGITFNGFGSADSTAVTGAVGFDDTARSTLGMTFLSATSVSGSGTITGVAGSFDDASLTSANSSIAFSGFNAVSGTGTALTGVDISFDDTTRVSGSGVDYIGFTNLAMVSGGATSLTGIATSFNDATQVSGSGIDYGGLASLATVAGDGTATITGVVGGFDDASLTSANSSIAYSGFNAVSGTGTALTGVDISFDDTTRVSGSGVDYSGFTNLATVSGAAPTLTGVNISFDDTTQVSGSGIDYGGLTLLATVSGNATALSGIATSFDDTTQVSGSGISYGGLTLLATVAGDGTATITGVAGTFDDATLLSAASAIDYSGFNAVSGTGTALTGVNVSFDDTTRVSGSGVDYSGFTNLATVSGAAPTVTGVNISFDDTTRVSGSGINYGGLTLLATVAGDGTATITGVAGSFDDATLVSATSAIDYSGFNAVSGTGTALTGVDISFDDTTRVSGSGVDYIGFTNLATVSGSATSLTGIATGFNDATQVSGSGIDYGGLTLLATVAGDGTATITGVAGNFDDATLVSAASAIDYSGFNAVGGTGTALTGVDISFDDTTRVSGSGVNYSGLTSLATVSGAALTLTGVNISFDDTTQVSGSGIDYGGLTSLATVSGNAPTLTGVDISFDDTTRVSGSGISYGGLTLLATVSGNATALSGIATSFDDTTQVSGSGIGYGGLTLLATVAGDGTATITGVSGSFNDSTLVSSASTLDYSGFNAVSGTGTAVTNVAGNFSLNTHLSATSGVNYSGFGLSTIAGAGGGTITGTARTYNVTGPDAGNDGTVSWTNFASLSDAGGGTFNLATGGLSGTIAGGTGSTLSYAGNAGPVSVNLQTGAATSVSAGITGINNLVGSGSIGDTLTGTNANATWTISGANGGTLSTGFTFANFENLTGGSANDSFVLSGGTVSGAINGGGGSDTLSGSATYSISGPNAGTATGVASFTSIETLTGTGGNDTFTLAVASFNGTIDGAAGSDTLTAANVANNWVLTSVGAGTLNTTTIFSSIETMVGGTAMDTLSGSAPGGTTTMTDPTSLAVGPLNASGGVVNLTAGSLSGTGVIIADSGTFVSDTNVLGLGINLTNNLHMAGLATLWNFSAGSDAGSFSVANENISVQVAGVTRVASVGQQQAAAAIGTVAEQIGATIVEEANKTFGTDSVAEDIEYGFAGEIGATPPMDHRIDESGISLPRCVEEAREGMPCT